MFRKRNPTAQDTEVKHLRKKNIMRVKQKAFELHHSEEFRQVSLTKHSPG